MKDHALTAVKASFLFIEISIFKLIYRLDFWIRFYD